VFCPFALFDVDGLLCCSMWILFFFVAWILMFCFFILGMFVLGADSGVLPACSLVVLVERCVFFHGNLVFFCRDSYVFFLGSLAFGADSYVLPACILVFFMYYCVFQWESCFLMDSYVSSWEFLFSVRIQVFCPFAFLFFDGLLCFSMGNIVFFLFAWIPMFLSGILGFGSDSCVLSVCILCF